MNLEEIRRVAGKIKDVTEHYETGETPLNGRCIWTSKDLAEVVQAIIRQNVARLADSSIEICVGNYYSQGDPAFVVWAVSHPLAEELSIKTSMISPLRTMFAKNASTLAGVSKSIDGIGPKTSSIGYSDGARRVLYLAERSIDKRRCVLSMI